MPMTWVEPEIFFTYRGINVYHTYKDDDWESGVRMYWFTLDITAGEGSDEEFDVRDLATWAWPPHDEVTFVQVAKAAITDAIDQGLLELPEDVMPTPNASAVEAPSLPQRGREVHRISISVERYVYADNSPMVQAAYGDMMDDLKSVLPSNEFEARCEIEVVSPDDDRLICDFLREQYEDEES